MLYREGSKVKLMVPLNHEEPDEFVDEFKKPLPALSPGVFGVVVEVLYEDEYSVEGMDNEYSVEFNDNVYRQVYGHEIALA